MSIDTLLPRKPVRAGVFAILILLSVWLWYQFAYPSFSLVDLSISRSEALTIARKYIKSFAAIDPVDYKHAIIFDVPTNTDFYLQKSLGLKGQEQFMRQHNLELYFWTIRFFKENQKEEYRLTISSKSGEIISYWHILDDAASRPPVNEQGAKENGRAFLTNTFHYDFKDWNFHEESKSKFDNRVENKFKWEKKNVYVPWSSPEQGGGKILTTVTVSGNEIQSFVKQTFLVPEQFDRYIEAQKETGRNLSLIGHIGSIALFMVAIWIIQVRRNHLCMNVTKFFYVYLALLLFLLTIASAFNNAQGYLFSYPTTQPFVSYFLRQGVYEMVDRFLFFGCFIIPSLSGELLRYENFPKRHWMGIFQNMSTSFLTRPVGKAIFLGYGFAVLMFGFQTLIFEFGFRYCDVWMEHERLSMFSTAYFPFFGILLMALSAGVTEETFYRLFGVNVFYTFTRNTFLAFLIPSVIWGLGHTGYLVFPFWFRGLEVTLLGIFTCLVYRSYGLLTVIVQHYLFDAFWGSSVYLFGKSTGVNFWMSIVILAFPAIFGFVAFLMNRSQILSGVRWRLTKQQNYNLNILKGHISLKKTQSNFHAETLRQELIGNGWDIAVVDEAFTHCDIVDFSK
ncbi:MAG: CPBP family intramembrane metalloprotease [Candidatus Omnitrophica bacterium]|nr:CPBP family intramembrane metalloprotease [Candidatus Omnitrophota bacterium]